MIYLQGLALINAGVAAGLHMRTDFVDGGVSITVQRDGETVFAVHEMGYEDRARAERQASDFLRNNIMNRCYAHGDACSSDCRFRVFRYIHYHPTEDRCWKCGSKGPFDSHFCGRDLTQKMCVSCFAERGTR